MSVLQYRTVTRIFCQDKILSKNIIKGVCHAVVVECEALCSLSVTYLYYTLTISPGVGNGSSLQYSCLEDSMDRGAWWAIVHGITKSQTRLKWLSTYDQRGEFTGRWCLKYHVWNEMPVQVQCTILDAWGWCTGTTQRDGVGREEGGRFRMGNTCIPVVDSFWCLAELIQLCKVWE